MTAYLHTSRAADLLMHFRHGSLSVCQFVANCFGSSILILWSEVLEFAQKSNG